MGLASCGQKPCVPSEVWGFVLNQECASRTRAGDDLRRHGGRKRTGCRAGLGIANRGGLNCYERERIKKALLDYCGH
jgi:hypothetical protein